MDIETAAKRILLVENDDINAEFVRLILKNKYDIDFVEEGEKAVTKCNETAYDLILMDIDLGMGINGIEATQEIRKIKGYETTPVIAITAYAMKGDQEKILDSGLTHYISKPYDISKLKNMVKEILQT